MLRALTLFRVGFLPARAPLAALALGLGIAGPAVAAAPGASRYFQCVLAGDGSERKLVLNLVTGPNPAEIRRARFHIELSGRPVLLDGKLHCRAGERGGRLCVPVPARSDLLSFALHRSGVYASLRLTADGAPEYQGMECVELPQEI